jgi:hypothetical protein
MPSNGVKVLTETPKNPRESLTMKRLSLIALALATPLAVMADTTVFSDNFTGASTIQSATPGTPTANSADYEVFTSVGSPAGYSLGANALHFASAASSSALAEVSARFAASPVTLMTVGDYINLTLTFVDTANVLVSGLNLNSSINIGLFNSSGVNLNQGVRLDGTTVTGGSQNYVGYVSRLFLNGNASGYNRKAQASSGTAQNQDLLFNNASGSAAFNNPVGTSFTGTSGGTTGFTTGLVQGNTYTYSYNISLTAANAVLVNEQIFNGSTATGTPLINFSGTSTSGNFVGSTFDSLSFGFRYTAAGATGGALDINQITVTSNVPEPSFFALSGLGILALGFARRWKR